MARAPAACIVAAEACALEHTRVALKAKGPCLPPRLRLLPPVSRHRLRSLLLQRQTRPTRLRATVLGPLALMILLVSTGARPASTAVLKLVVVFSYSRLYCSLPLCVPPPSLPLSLFSQTTAKPVAQAAPPPIDKQAEAMTATTTFLPKLARGGATTSNATDAVADRAKIRGSPPRRSQRPDRRAGVPLHDESRRTLRCRPSSRSGLDGRGRRIQRTRVQVRAGHRRDRRRPRDRRSHCAADRVPGA